MAESDTSSSDEYDTESDLDEQAPTSSWSYVTSSDVHVEVDDVDVFLLDKAREESSAVITRLLQKMFGTSEHHIASVDVACFIEAWLDSSILSNFASYANRSLRTSDVATLDDILSFVEVELWLSFYGVTPEAFYKPSNTTCYPAAATVMTQAKYRSILTALSAPPQQTSNSSAHWNSPFTINRDVSNTMEQIRRLCSDIGFVNEVTIASLDDDLLRLRSQLVDGTGLAHVRNPKKGYGTVHNGIVSVGTGIYLGGHISARGESAVDAVRVLQRSLCGVSTESQIKLPGIIHALDRGYQSQAVNQQIVETGGSIVGTHKRTGRFPFTYDQTASRFQRSVMKKGERAAYWATQRLPTRAGVPHGQAYALAYRSGLGNVALCYTTHASVGPGRWSYIPSSKSDDTSSISRIIFTEFEDNVQRLTVKQRTPEWFLLRKFRITGSVAATIFRLVARSDAESDTHNRDFDIETIATLLSLVRAPSEDRTADESLSGRQDGSGCAVTRADLSTKSGEELRHLCRTANLAAYGTKAAMINRLLGGTEQELPEEEFSVADKLLSAWFMKPISSPDMKMGTHNEEYIARHIGGFLDSHSDFHIEELATYGLLCNKQQPVAAFSPDNIASVLSVNAGRFYAVMEYKTRTRPTTEQSERRLTQLYGAYVSVDIALDGFGGRLKKLIPEASHRVQILHSIVCGGIQDGFLVYASTSSIIRVVHIKVGDHVSWTYRAALNTIQRRYMAWIYDGEPVPTFASHQLGHCVDQQTLLQTFHLWKQLVVIVNNRRKPLPAAKHIIPSLIALWNRVKGGIDVYSRFLKNVKAKHCSLSPTGAIWLRMIMTLIYNAYQSYLLFQANGFLMNTKMCMSYKAYQKFRQKLPSFKTFCRDAAFALADNTTTTSVPGSTVENDDTEASNSGNLKLSFGYKKRIHFETGKEWKELRLSKPGTHKMVSIEGGFQRCCEMCCRLNHDVENIEHTRMGYKTRYACDTCKVSLCRAKRWGGEESCFDKFHSERKLTDPCKHPDAMQPTKRNVNRAPPPNRKRSQLSDPPSRRAPSLRLKIKERRRSLRLSEHERKLS